MHSTLQAELRFSQIICSSCRHCARQQSQNARRSFCTAPRLRSAQKPSNSIGSLSSRGISDDSQSHGAARVEIARDSDHGGEESTPAHQHRPGPHESSAIQTADDARAKDFYGSPAKRRLRNRMNKDADTEYQAPEWFMDSNVALFGSGFLAPGTPSRIKTVAADLLTGEPLEQNSSPDSGGAPSHGSDGKGDDPKSIHESLGKSTLTEDKLQQSEALPPTKSSSSSSVSSRYYVVDEQYEEVMRTARGLMQVSHNQSSQNGADSFRDHLHLQYAGKDGDLLLDHLVQDIARQLGCDLMVVDAQDIADLIHRNHTNQSTAKAGRMLSYDVLSTAFPDLSEHNSSHEAQDVDDDDGDIEDIMDEMDSTPASPRIGMPMFIGRPTAILKTIIGQIPELGDGMRSEMPRGTLRMWPDFGDPQKPRDEQGALSGLIYKLLKSLSDRRTAAGLPGKEQNSDLEQQRETAAKRTGVPKGGAIVHVRDFRAIQSLDMGRSFLNNLHRQLAQRRNKGESVLLIGTDSAREDQEPFTRERINESQSGGQDGKSQNIVLTPVLPNTTSKLALLHDRKQRIATVNMRHLWETLRFWKPSVFAHLEPGFWRGDFSDRITRSDRSCLEGQAWNHQYIQRLATYIAGTVPSNRDGETDTSTKDQPQPIISAATSHLNHSDKTKIRWAEKQSKEAKKEVPERHMSKDDRLARIRASASKYEKRLMGGIIEAKNINTTFNDVHMPVETIDTLQTLTTLSLIRPEAFKYGVLASDKIPGLLLYGPPGTGKTLAAKAVAKESGATMLEVSAADINDMYVGEGEKNVKALFSLARKLSPCVVFLDEADAMFSARSNQGRRVSHRELLNQFLKEWDGMSNDSGSAFIMVATNRPMDLDDAVLRRLPRRLLVDLPTEPDRLEILKIHLRHEKLGEDVNLQDLAKKTPFYSGSDLKNVAVAAALNCVREENELAKQHKGEEPYQHPERRTLTEKHFDKALDEISASISEDMSSLRDIKKFDEQFGDKRGKKKKAPRLGFPTEKENEKARDTVKVRD
ncbi:uncharacterized protein PV07_02326 [Cladophialophora immunda]|uniref:AAA+ ATPase domain-containing protein n=1 Tax=Cladophialophora immunda TaxID=569365 RepID=A0A0D2A5J7_9EURO|nr:uncharacterized protein PV07_02326 [Cladophialophora immunda]KIW35641.1 hypothetical protein PV07_02326 [Cladophialophora immunda]OQV07193.1 hypothetical protein CLAIMM_11659 [Cladophialophora immunda]